MRKLMIRDSWMASEWRLVARETKHVFKVLELSASPLKLWGREEELSVELFTNGQ
jgi:hypothetical protein